MFLVKTSKNAPDVLALAYPRTTRVRGYMNSKRETLDSTYKQKVGYRTLALAYFPAD